MVAREVALATPAATPSAATTVVATTADMAAMHGITVMGNITDGMGEIGVMGIAASGGAGVTRGRTGVGAGDIPMVITTTRGLILPTPTTRRIALRAIGVLPTGTTILRHRILPGNPELLPPSPGDQR